MGIGPQIELGMELRIVLGVSPGTKPIIMLILYRELAP